MAATLEQKETAVSREVEDVSADLVEWLTDTAAEQYPDPKERFQALAQIAEDLIHGSPEAMGRRILSYLRDPKLYRDNVIAAGLCPECFGTLNGHHCRLDGDVA